MEIILEGHMIFKLILACILVCVIEIINSIALLRYYFRQEPKIGEEDRQ